MLGACVLKNRDVCSPTLHTEAPSSVSPAWLQPEGKIGRLSNSFSCYHVPKSQQWDHLPSVQSLTVSRQLLGKLLFLISLLKKQNKTLCFLSRQQQSLFSLPQQSPSANQATLAEHRLTEESLGWWVMWLWGSSREQSE